MFNRAWPANERLMRCGRAVDASRQGVFSRAWPCSQLTYSTIKWKKATVVHYALRCPSCRTFGDFGVFGVWLCISSRDRSQSHIYAHQTFIGWPRTESYALSEQLGAADFRIRPLADKFLYQELVRVNAYKCAKFQVPSSISYRDMEGIP